MTPKHLGILGGMGPVATMRFYEHVIEAAIAHGAVRDSDFPRISLASAVIPDFSAAGFGDEEEALAEMLRAAQELNAAGAEVIAIPCNSAHVFFSTIDNAVEASVLDIRSIVADAIHAADIRKAGILGTKSTIEKGVYEGLGFAPVYPTDEEHAAIALLIDRGEINVRDETDTAALALLMSALSSREAEGIVLGCTELSTITIPESTTPFFDSSRLLAEAAVRACYAN